THQTTQIAPANRAGFCIVYLCRQIIKSSLKERGNLVNESLINFSLGIGRADWLSNPPSSAHMLCATSFRGDAKHRTSDAQLRIGEAIVQQSRWRGRIPGSRYRAPRND